MKYILLLLPTLLFSLNSFAQIDLKEGIIDLADIYRKSHGVRDISEEQLQSLEKYNGTELEKVAHIVKEISQKNNKVTNLKYLHKPDSSTLKIFHTMIMVNYNSYEQSPQNNNKVVKKFLDKKISDYEQIMQYYNSLFTSVINKNRPFDYSETNWDLEELGLKNEKEKAIFFFVFIDKIGYQIALYHQAYKGANWNKIEQYVDLLPMINGKPYYFSSGFGFEDFKMTIYKKEQGLKEYYLPLYYEVLDGHYSMLKTKGNKIKAEELNISSILNDKKYVHYKK